MKRKFYAARPLGSIQEWVSFRPSVACIRRIHEVSAYPHKCSAHAAHRRAEPAADVPADRFTVRRPDDVVTHAPIPIPDFDTDLVIEVPVGFVTDFASIPRPLWTLASPHGFYSRASIIHDFLYWDQRCTREQADRIMLIAMRESAVGVAERQAIYAGVQAGGQSSWDGNATARAQGMLRTVPAQFINQVQPLDTWPDFRARLMKQGAGEASRTDGPPPTYCAAGN